MVARKRITQDTFDEAVRENIDEFEMTPEEAVRSAVEEFGAQGVDLSGIIKAAEGGNVEGHAVAVALTAVRSAKDAFVVKQSPEHAHSLGQALTGLAALLGSSLDKDSQAQALSVASQQGAVPEVLDCCSVLVRRNAELCAALAALLAALGSAATQEDFHKADRVAVLADILRAHAGDSAIVAAASACAEAAAAKHEGNKCACVDGGLVAQLIRAAREPALGAEALVGVCAALRSFATADDARPATSRAFQNGRAIARAGAPEALLQVLQGERGREAAVAAAACNALRRVAVNDDICSEFAEAGGVDATLQVLQDSLCSASGPAVPRAACALLRQLANSDPLKEAVLARGGLALIQALVSAHLSNSGVLEQALGLLVTLLLRNPAAAERAAGAGCVDTVLEAMQAAESDAGFPDSPLGAQWVQRQASNVLQWDSLPHMSGAVGAQACMALRNMVARNTELQPLLLEKGAEAHLRRAKAAHPATCGDVGSAALRDLGFDDYLK